MELFKGARIIGLTLFLEKEKTLIIGDVHIGYEEALNRQGVLIPRLQFKEQMAELARVFSIVAPETVVLMGDLKHEFGGISDSEWHDTLQFLDFILARAKVILLRGNHDKILGPLAKKRGLEIKDYACLGDYFFCHGDRLFDENPDFKKAKAVMIGHEHPAIGIRDGARLEKYKCFLSGSYRWKKLIVLPSFTFLTEGTDVLQEALLSPFIRKIDDFSAIVVSDKAYDFGKIKNLRRLAG